uniref:G-protein coupled receptors family 1 profile domain-containing protein n=1 Tax=Globodera rostochiensis TaxID=31243 RepID=A0A914GRB5_GLORO
MLVASAMCLGVNLIVIRAIVVDNDLFKLNSYKFMLALGAVDCSQSCVHFVSGFYTIYESTFKSWHSQALGAIVTPSYVFYIIITIVLAFNRLIVLTSDRLDELLFSPFWLKFWFLLPALISLSFALALCSPWAAISYLPDQFSWAYDESRPLSNLVQRLEEIIEVAGIPVAGLIYGAIFFVILYKRINGLVLRQTGAGAERKVLIQAFVITAYCTVLNYLWHNSQWLLPNTKTAKCALNFMWICNGAVNPLIYLAVNSTIRRRIGTVFGALSRTNGQHNMRTTADVPPARLLMMPIPMQNNFCKT